MHYTRHPLVESVLTAKGGSKLAVRSIASKEEYLLDAVEIVCFGSNYFFRPTADSTHSFILPVSAFEVVEVVAERMALKIAKPPQSQTAAREEKTAPTAPSSSPISSSSNGKNKRKRKQKGGGSGAERQEPRQEILTEVVEVSAEEVVVSEPVAPAEPVVQVPRRAIPLPQRARRPTPPQVITQLEETPAPEEIFEPKGGSDMSPEKNNEE